MLSSHATLRYACLLIVVPSNIYNNEHDLPISAVFLCFLLDMLVVAGIAAQEKDLGIALLRRPLRMLEHEAHQTPLIPT